MNGADALQWGALVVERGAAPVALDDAGFREWMTGRRVFVSSVMDAQMNPDRQAVRDWLERWGASPIMWEAITPRDQHPERAYLEGVDSSALLVLLLGARYGVPDGSGYAPTHKEVNRAEERHIPRLLFLRSDVTDADRDGKANDWLRGLYHQVAGATYEDPRHLCVQLEQRLRELASQQESLWLKLGPLVFPGRISQKRSNGEAVFTVTARVREGPVRRALFELGGPMTRMRADRLTWLNETKAVAVRDVGIDTGRASESTVVVTAAESRRGNPMAGLGWTSYSSGGQTYGPADQAEIWARSAVLGEAVPEVRGSAIFNMLGMLRAHDGPTLPDILRADQAEGWMAEGLTRLFLVEHLSTKFAGHFERFDVGPATGTGVRIYATFVIPGETRPALIEGVVPLR